MSVEFWKNSLPAAEWRTPLHGHGEGVFQQKVAFPSENHSR
jgi:hypothetical protein